MLSRTSRNRTNNTMSKSIRAVFEMEDNEIISINSKEKLNEYNSIKKHYFQDSLSSGIASPPEMLTVNYSSSERDSSCYTPNDSDVNKMSNNINEFKAYLDKAIKESEHYLVLSKDDIIKIQNELIILNQRSKSINERIELETKVRDAALSLRKLHSSNKKMMLQADEQLDNANNKLDQLIKEIWNVKNKIYSNQNKLFQHNSAILAMEIKRNHNNDSNNMAVTSNPFNDSSNSISLDHAICLLAKKDQQIQNLKKEFNNNNKDEKYESLLNQNKQLTKELESKKQIEKQLAYERVEKQELKEQLNLIKKDNTKLLQFKGNDEAKLKIEHLKMDKDNQYQINLNINEQLAKLYHQLPICNEGEVYSFNNFIKAINELLLENQDLIEKILMLQIKNKELEGKDNANNIENMLTMEEVEEILLEVENELIQCKQSNQEMKLECELYKKSIEKNNMDLNLINDLKIKVKNLEQDLETKDMLCTKYQQILNDL